MIAGKSLTISKSRIFLKPRPKLKLFYAQAAYIPQWIERESQTRVRERFNVYMVKRKNQQLRARIITSKKQDNFIKLVCEFLGSCLVS